VQGILRNPEFLAVQSHLQVEMIVIPSPVDEGALSSAPE
jgi:hypothetical protein